MDWPWTNWAIKTRCVTMEYISIEAKHAIRSSKKHSMFQCEYHVVPYKGCEYGCLYCPGHLQGDTSDKVWVEINSPVLLKKEMKLMDKGIVCITGYQPAERIYRVIRKILSLLSSRRFPVHVLTRSDIILDDIDIIGKIGKDSWGTVSLFLPGLDEKITRIFEPESPTPKERINVIRQLKENDIRTGVALSPVIPYISDSEEGLRSTIKELSHLKVDYIVPQILDLKDEYRSNFVQAIKKHYPKHLIKYKKLYELGPEPDVRYERRILRRINKIIEEEGISNTVPEYSDRIEQKQVNLENFLKK